MVEWLEKYEGKEIERGTLSRCSWMPFISSNLQVVHIDIIGSINVLAASDGIVKPRAFQGAILETSADDDEDIH